MDQDNADKYLACGRMSAEEAAAFCIVGWSSTAAAMPPGGQIIASYQADGRGHSELKFATMSDIRTLSLDSTTEEPQLSQSVPADLEVISSHSRLIKEPQNA